MRRTTRYRPSLLGTALLLTTTLIPSTASCANSERISQTRNTGPASASAPAQPHNDTDMAFAQQMISRHTWALDMATLVADHDAGDQVRDLAGRIQKAQRPEIDTMTGWLRAWGAPVTGHAALGTGTPDVQQTRQLREATGPEFDRLWLQLMIEHHRGAVEMARTELTAGNSSDARELAGQIISGRQAEVDEMSGLLG